MMELLNSYKKNQECDRDKVTFYCTCTSTACLSAALAELVLYSILVIVFYCHNKKIKQ